MIKKSEVRRVLVIVGFVVYCLCAFLELEGGTKDPADSHTHTNKQEKRKKRDSVKVYQKGDVKTRETGFSFRAKR